MTRLQQRKGQGSSGWSILHQLDDTELFKQCSLLSPSQFARACRERGLVVSDDELEYYERRGWLSPLLRIPCAKQWLRPRGDGFIDEVEVPEGAQPTPDLVYRYGTYGTTGAILLTLRDEELLIDPSEQPFQPWREQRDPATREETVSTYYVLYQLLRVLWLQEHVELEEHWRHVGQDEIIAQKGFRVRQNRLPKARRQLTQVVQDLDHLVLLLLAIQNRYRPEITGTIAGYHNPNDWFVYRDRFSPTAVLVRLPATVEQLRDWRDELCRQGKRVDPLVEWYDLVGYVAWSKRETLGGPARLAQDLYVMADMIDRFLRDRAREEGIEEPAFTCLGQPEYEQHKFGGVASISAIATSWSAF